jgi:hypothetical protein
MNVVSRHLFDGRWIIYNADIVPLERITIGNPAELLQQADFQVPTTDVNRDLTVIDGQHGSIDIVFLNPQDGDQSIAITNGCPRLTEECVLDAICNIGRLGDGETTNDSVQELSSDPPFCGQIQVPRNLDPLNEFTSNDALFYGAFPTAFPIGCGLQESGSIPEYDVRHMLMQYRRIFTEDSNLIFILFNQRQRHVVARSLAAKVKASPANFDPFAQIVNAPGYQSDAKLRQGTQLDQLLTDSSVI